MFSTSERESASVSLIGLMITGTFLRPSALAASYLLEPTTISNLFLSGLTNSGSKIPFSWIESFSSVISPTDLRTFDSPTNSFVVSRSVIAAIKCLLLMAEHAVYNLKLFCSEKSSAGIENQWTYAARLTGSTLSQARTRFGLFRTNGSAGRRRKNFGEVR